MAHIQLQVSLFQAKLAGPYTTERQISYQNYLPATPTEEVVSGVMSTCLSHTMLTCIQ